MFNPNDIYQPSEKKSLREKQIYNIYRYTSSFFKDFNENLRRNIIPRYTYELISYVNMFNFIKNNRVSKPLKTYRGVRISEELIQNFKNSITGVESSFISTSSDENVARSFISRYNYKCCIMIIDIPEDAYACDISDYSDSGHEKEILIAPGKLRLVKHENNIYYCQYENDYENIVMNTIYPLVITPSKCEMCDRDATLVLNGSNLCIEHSIEVKNMPDYIFKFEYNKNHVILDTTENPIFRYGHLHRSKPKKSVRSKPKKSVRSKSKKSSRSKPKKSSRSKPKKSRSKK